MMTWLESSSNSSAGRPGRTEWSSWGQRRGRGEPRAGDPASVRRGFQVREGLWEERSCSTTLRAQPAVGPAPGAWGTRPNAPHYPVVSVPLPEQTRGPEQGDVPPEPGLFQQDEARGWGHVWRAPGPKGSTFGPRPGGTGDGAEPEQVTGRVERGGDGGGVEGGGAVALRRSGRVPVQGSPSQMAPGRSLSVRTSLAPGLAHPRAGPEAGPAPFTASPGAPGLRQAQACPEPPPLSAASNPRTTGRRAAGPPRPTLGRPMLIRRAPFPAADASWPCAAGPPAHSCLPRDSPKPALFP